MSINQDDNNVNESKVLADQAFIDALYQDVAKECVDNSPNDEQPSAELDQRILAAAHKAVIAKPQLVENKKRAQLSPWFTTIAKAASIILVVTLVIDQMDYPLTYQVTEQTAPESFDNQQDDIYLAQSPMPKSEMSQRSHRRKSSPATAIGNETRLTALRKSADLSSYQGQSASIHQPILEVDSEVAKGQQLQIIKSAELVATNESRNMIAAVNSTSTNSDEPIIRTAMQSQEKTARLEKKMNIEHQTYLKQLDTIDKNNLDQQGLLEKSHAKGPMKNDNMHEHQDQIIAFLTVNEYNSLLELSKTAKINWRLVADVSTYFHIQIYVNKDKPLDYILDKATYILINKNASSQQELSDVLKVNRRAFDDISLIKNKTKQ